MGKTINISFLRDASVAFAGLFHGYWHRSLGDYYSNAAYRYLTYLVITLLAGIGTFAAVELYAMNLYPSRQPPLSFKRDGR